MSKKKPEKTAPVDVVQMGVIGGPEGVHRILESVISDGPVEIHCLDGGDVEVKVHGIKLAFADGLVLRWGRRV